LVIHPSQRSVRLPGTIAADNHRVRARDTYSYRTIYYVFRRPSSKIYLDPERPLHCILCRFLYLETRPRNRESRIKSRHGCSPLHLPCACVSLIALNIAPHLWKCIEELLVYRPILQVTVIALKQRTRVMRASILVKEESIFKGKRPVETQEARVAAGKIGTCACLEDCGVVVE
jgi:hypothetical protein